MEGKTNQAGTSLERGQAQFSPDNQGEEAKRGKKKCKVCANSVGKLELMRIEGERRAKEPVHCRIAQGTLNNFCSTDQKGEQDKRGARNGS